MISRRTFLKSTAAVSLAAVAPTKLFAKEVPLPQGIYQVTTATLSQIKGENFLTLKLVSTERFINDTYKFELNLTRGKDFMFDALIPKFDLKDNLTDTSQLMHQKLRLTARLNDENEKVTTVECAT